MAGSEGRGIQSIEVGGRILTALVRANSPMMLRDLASAADIAPAQCHAYLTSFRHVGLIEQEGLTGQYRLGPYAMRLGIGRIRSLPVLARGTRALAHLATELGHMALMVVWGPHGPTVVQVHDGASSLNLNIRRGTLFSMTGTASGLVFAAFFDSPEMLNLIKLELSGQMPQRSVGAAPAKSSFEEGVLRTKKSGYGSTAGAPIPGIDAISGPVFDEAGKMAFAITIVGRTNALALDPESPAVRSLLQISGALSRHAE